MCNCITATCNNLQRHNCTSAIGCFATFKTQPRNTEIYGCIEELALLNKQECSLKVMQTSKNRIAAVTKCCYEDHCNMPSLIEQYFPTECKYCNPLYVLFYQIIEKSVFNRTYFISLCAS